MRDMKQREMKQRHQNAGVPGVETAGQESAAQKCMDGNCGKRKQRHKVAAGVENARHEYSGKVDYGNPLIAKYM